MQADFFMFSKTCTTTLRNVSCKDNSNYNAATIGTGNDSRQKTDIERMEVPSFLLGMGH